MIECSVYPLDVGVWLCILSVELLAGTFHDGLNGSDADGKPLDGSKNGSECRRGGFDLHGSGV